MEHTSGCSTDALYSCRFAAVLFRPPASTLPCSPCLLACAAYRATYPDKEDPLIDLRAQFKCARVWLLWVLAGAFGRRIICPDSPPPPPLHYPLLHQLLPALVTVPSLSLRQALRMPSMLLQTRTSLPGLPGCNLPLPPPALLPCAGSC